MSPRPFKLASILLLPALLVLTGLAGAEARAVRQEKAAHAPTPSDFAGLVVLSGFRPIAVDMLWIRSEDLAKERRYYELLSLYRLITALDPHFEGAWVYNSFNLAYRLSKLEDTPERRWRWTREALLYAMEGMKKNPDSDQIASALALIYYHRVAEEDYHVRQVLLDKELNPEGKSVIELARYWAERGYRKKPHTIYIDWVLEFIYASYAEYATDQAVKLEYLYKRLEIWRYVAKAKPLAARRAREKIVEIEAAIAGIKSAH